MKQLFSIGIHPWHTFDINIEKEIIVLKETANLKNVIAIGECGLDKLKGNSMEKQIEIFKAQAILANEVGKPLIIHCVKAFPEIIKLHKQINPVVPWIIHNFNKKEDIAKQLTDLGFILSFGQSLINKNYPAVKAFSLLPGKTFFLETDEADGGQIKQIYEHAAIIKNKTPEQLAGILKENFEMIFKIKTNEWE